MIAALKPYFLLMRLDRPIGTLLLLWPMLIALWLASNGIPNFKIFIIFVAGVLLTRSAGCVINDIADRDFDKYVQRTMMRPLAQSLIAVAQARLLFVMLMLSAFALVLQLHTATIALSLVGAALMILYPFSKRFTKYPQLILGMAFAWSIPMIYCEVLGRVNLECMILYCSILFWVVAYDTQYAMADREDDLKIGIKSTAITFAAYDRVIIFVLQLLCLLGFLFIGLQRGFGWAFYVT